MNAIPWASADEQLFHAVVEVRIGNVISRQVMTRAEWDQLRDRRIGLRCLADVAIDGAIDADPHGEDEPTHSQR